MSQTTMHEEHTGLGLGQRVLLIASTVAVYAANFWPATQVRDAGLAALGNPPYAGFSGIFLPHLLLYSTFTAFIAALFWLGFVRMRVLAAPRLRRPTPRQVGAGTVGGIVALIAAIAFVVVVFPPGSLHWIDPDPWKIAGNVFSNFYEEFVFRGFMLVALGAAIGPWPASIVTSAMWGYTHAQYPLSLQGLITATGIYFCWLTRKSRSLWTPYVAHMILDIGGDSLFG